MNMRQTRKIQTGQKIVSIVLVIYFLCFVFRILEYFMLRTDQTWVGEAVVHKVIGILILLIAMKLLQFDRKEIGYTGEATLFYLMKGLAFGLGVYTVAYAAEIMIVVLQGKFDAMQIYISTYAVDQNIGNHTTIFFFLICIIGNIINVIMEEGIFRGLFIKMLEQKYSFIISALVTSLLFGFWHIVGPIRNYLDGVSSMEGMIANAMMLLITSALVGFKFALLTKMTGNLFMAMGDHFVNNTIVNLIHVISNTGADEMMFFRVAIAQSVSFMIVLAYYFKLYYRKV